MPKKRPLTDAEKQFLIKNHDKMTYVEMAEHIGDVSVNHVRNKCLSLGITKKRYVRKDNPPIGIDRIRDYYKPSEPTTADETPERYDARSGVTVIDPRDHKPIGKYIASERIYVPNRRGA